MDAVGNDERSISITREIVTSPSLIVCMAMPPVVRGRGSSRGRGPARYCRLGRRPLRHGRAERPLPLEEMCFSLPDQDVGSIPQLVTLFHQALRGLPYLLRLDSNLHW